jgi:hypothetical protein
MEQPAGFGGGVCQGGQQMGVEEGERFWIHRPGSVI